MSTVNERFREVRKHFKYSQEQFSEDLGISRTHISNIENGNDNPSLTLIKLTCVRFFINEEWLASGIGEMLKSNSHMTNEQAIAKYNSICNDFEKMLQERKGEELEYTVESITFLYELLTAYRLDGKEKTLYLRKIYDSIDTLERLFHFVCSSPDIFVDEQASPDSRNRFKEMCNSIIDRLIHNIKDASNVCLEKYGDDAKL